MPRSIDRMNPLTKSADPALEPAHRGPRRYRDPSLMVEALVALALGTVCVLWPGEGQWLRPVGCVALLLGLLLLVIHGITVRRPAEDAAPTQPMALTADRSDDLPG